MGFTLFFEGIMCFEGGNIFKMFNLFLATIRAIIEYKQSKIKNVSDLRRKPHCIPEKGAKKVYPSLELFRYTFYFVLWVLPNILSY